MKALILSDQGVQYSQSYSPNVDPSLIPVQVSMAGICETDLQLIQGYMGFKGVLGHEFVGVAQSGKFSGMRVVGEINCACHQCATCQQGHSNHCPNRTVIGILNHDGAFADIVFVPEKNLLKVPDSVPDEIAVFTEPLAAAFQIPNQIDLNQVRTAVVVGDGRLGYLIAQVLRNLELDVLVVGKHEAKLKRLEHESIKTVQLDSLDSEFSRSFDLAVDCAGSRSGITTCLSLLRPKGTLVLKTTVSQQHEISLAQIVIDEINVVGSRCGPFDKALNALEHNEVEVKSLITSICPLSQGTKALELAASPEHSKVLFDMSLN